MSVSIIMNKRILINTGEPTEKDQKFILLVFHLHSQFKLGKDSE